jgi:hypothetical protein
MTPVEKITDEYLSNLSTSELKELLNEYETEYAILDANQMSIKISINSMYGVFASPYFHFFSYAIASTVTAMGRHITQSTEKMFNKYFQEVWPKDTKLHEIMEVSDVQPPIKNVAIYCDTDSVYFSLDEVFENCTLPEKYSEDKEFGGTHFILDIWNNRLNSYLKKFFDNYAAHFGVENLHNLELEKICRSGILAAPKKYVLDVSWTEGGKNGLFYKKNKKFNFTGGEVVQSSTPKYVKNILEKTIVDILNSERGKINMPELLSKVKTIKEEYFLQDIDVIAKTVTVNDYDKHIVSDGKDLIFNKGATYQAKGAAYYNHLLNTTESQYKQKYPMIKSKDSVKWYCAEIPIDKCDRFAYLPNMFPYQFAPEIDKEAQFEKSFLAPLNAYIRALDKPPIDNNLFTSSPLF